MLKQLALTIPLAVLLFTLQTIIVTAAENTEPLKLSSQPHELIGKIWSTKDK